MRKLAILGASGHGRVVADIAESCGWNQIDFYDDAWPKVTKNACWTINGAIDDFYVHSPEFQGVIVGIGDNKTRLSIIDQLLANKMPLISLIHPSAVISQHASIGLGVVVMPQVVINVGVKIGDGVILNTSCSIEHDCKLEDGVHISPGAHLAGGVVVCKSTWVGIGANVRQYLSIGNNTIVGAGATVVSNVASNVTVVGTPAKPLVGV